MIGLNTPQAAGWEQSIDLTAMVDVLFTILIFLLLTMGATEMTTHLELASSAHRPPAPESGPPAVAVELRSGAWGLGEERYRSFEDFQAAFLAAHGGETERPVRIKPQRNLEVEHLVRVMNFLGEQGFSNLQIQSRWTP